MNLDQLDLGSMFSTPATKAAPSTTPPINGEEGAGDPNKGLLDDLGGGAGGGGVEFKPSGEGGNEEEEAAKKAAEEAAAEEARLAAEAAAAAAAAEAGGGEGGEGDEGAGGGDEGNILSDLAAQYNLTDYEAPEEESFEALVDLTDKVSTTKAQEQLDAYFKQFPDLYDVVNHAVNGGKVSEFLTTRYEKGIDYSQVVIDDNNSEQHADIVRTSLIDQGWSEEDADAEVQDLKELDRLLGRAKRVLPVLQKGQAAKAQEATLKAQQAAEAAAAEAAKTWKEVETTINSGVLNNIQIPKGEQPKFYKWLSEDTGNGTTASNQDWAKLSKQEQLEIEYYVYKKLQLSDIVAQKVKTREVSKLRKKTGQNSSRMAGGKGSRSKTKKTISSKLDGFTGIS